MPWLEEKVLLIWPSRRQRLVSLCEIQKARFKNRESVAIA
jgi:hypothetical protein